ncbi:hypothetical protein FB45DRAFT_1065176 [Roridomyces roridus]|uniref:BTB domain-containing protein n=1 Tax=Roridomyces roridus TaxID=1738132 RepID=A0AAD7B8J0_9AGAR|nr:hypothetical protein FB45DRAFT_1065176 [Roridomyces roridus]
MCRVVFMALTDRHFASNLENNVLAVYVAWRPHPHTHLCSTMSDPAPPISSPNPPPFFPTHPFDSTVGSDATLRSSDGADFHIQRAVLSLVSPVFETMFTLPQAASDSTIPVVELTETSRTLDGALRLFYPGTTLRLDANLIPTAKQHLEKFHATRPLAVYAIACRHQWHDVAVAAAREGLKHPLRVPDGQTPTEMHGMTAAAYYNLLQYHFLCGETAKKTLGLLEWLAYPTEFDVCMCAKTEQMTFTNSTNSTNHWVPDWFSAYLNGIRDVLLRTPGKDVRTLGQFSRALMADRCHNCHQFDLVSFGQSQLPARIAAALSKVELIF